MAVFVDQIFEQTHGYSFLGAEAVQFVSKTELSQYEKRMLKPMRKLPFFGKRRPKETRYFYHNARALSAIAMEKKRKLKSEVVAVLFRDSDDKATTGIGLWRDKFQSVLNGFEDEGFTKGVPMIPKPTSEAWLICALKKHPYHGCEKLESRSSSGQSSKPLKRELAQLIKDDVTAETLCDRVRDKRVDIDKIDMPSFTAFRECLEKVIK